MGIVVAGFIASSVAWFFYLPILTFAILFLWSKVHGEWICKGDYFMNGSFRSGKLGATH